MKQAVIETLAPEGGELLGYRELAPIGSGQTADVYRAVSRNGRTVALKVPKAEAMGDPRLGRMFAAEVALARTLTHPAVVACYGGAGGGPDAHLAMRYFPAGAIGAAEYDRETSIRVIADVAWALEYAHGRGLVHRDVKPGNVFVEGGRAYLGDFGSAAREGQAAGSVGSPFYMAPELWRGEPGTGRADIYSLGVLAYELLAGRRPIVGESVEALMAAHLNRQPLPVRGPRPDLPRTVTHLVDRALAKDPAARPSAAEVRGGLEAALGAQELPEGRETGWPVSAAPPPPRRLEASAMRAKEGPGFWGRLLGRS